MHGRQQQMKAQTFDTMTCAPRATARILLLDFYDSFTQNLAALLRTSTGAQIDVIPHDHYSSLFQLQYDLAGYNALVIGPGPGSPDDPKDIGVARNVWTHLPPDSQLPIFGVCLGLQSLCLAYGGLLKRLAVVKHGIISNVSHSRKDIFTGVDEVMAVRYHSLHVDMQGNNFEIEELAWVDDIGENGRILMAARHKTKPLWAVQYHPESICTQGGAEEVVRNWWRLAQDWNTANGRTTFITNLHRPLPDTRPQSFLEQVARESARPDDLIESENAEVDFRTITAPQLASTQICELLDAENPNKGFVFLDSASSPGRFSIIGVLSEETAELVRYYAGDDHVLISPMCPSPNHTQKHKLRSTDKNAIWKFLASYMGKRQVAADAGPSASPFWGGLVGYLSYEIGVASLDIPVAPRRPGRPDVQLTYIQRSIVIDTWSGVIYIQSLRQNDAEWLDSTKLRLQAAADMAMTPSPTPPLSLSSHTSNSISSASQLAAALSKASKVYESVKVVRPDQQRYIANIKKCQEYLAAGHSYELCLTALTQIHLPKPPASPWTLFTTLRARNPAPYSAYMRFPGVTILSSSPERFLSWSREGVCQLRPIKGTVKKTGTTTLEYAKSILYTQKEMAENLMIVDLIRHDLNQIAHQGSVNVTKLMKVEEYKSVYQLVSVIEGTVGKPKDSNTSSWQHKAPVTGFDVLARSLPPGSMTGAPKKRSVEILQGLESEERGVYSGVMGYWSVCGAGDWNVIIRTAFKYDNENSTSSQSELWRIGAGGAITSLSDPQAEWDEMEVKLGM